MPRSRGRQRPATRRGRRSAPTTWQARALKAAAPLLDAITTRHEAELWASKVLAEVTGDRPFLGRRDTRDHWLDAMLSYAARRRTPPAAAFVLALTAVGVTVPDSTARWATSLLSGLAWTTCGPLRPRKVTRGSDPWDDHRTWFLEYDDHVLVVTTARARLYNVLALDLLPLDAIELWDVIAGAELAATRKPVDVDEALAELARLSDLQRRLGEWPEMADREVAALLDARVGHAAAVHTPRVDELARAALLEDFAQDLGGEADHTFACLLQPIFGFADRYLDGNPLLWSPELIETLLLEWIPYETWRPELLPGMPGIVTCWVMWALSRRGLCAAHVLAAARTSREVLLRFRSLCERELEELGYEPHDVLLDWWEPAA